MAERHWTGQAHSIFVTDSMNTLNKTKLGTMLTGCQYFVPVNYLPASPGFSLLGVLGNERINVLAGAGDVRGALILNPLVVLAAVREMLSATRFQDDPYTLAQLIEK